VNRTEIEADLIFSALQHRRSFGLKELSAAPVERGLVERILEAANWAPSHGKTEPWRFAVYSGQSRQIISDAFGVAFAQLNREKANPAGEQAQRDRPWQAPVWIALGMQPDPKMPDWEELVAFGCAVQNAQIMASALGLASKWTSGAVAIHPHVAEVVGFAPDVQLFGFLYVGYPAGEWPAGQRRPVAEKVRWYDEGR
jgi:nitroreductase